MTLAQAIDGRHVPRMVAVACGLVGFLLTGCASQEPPTDPNAGSSTQSGSNAQPSAGSEQTELTLTSGLAPSRPTRVVIPAIGVNSPVNPVGLDAQGKIEVPPLDRPKLTGWYEKGPTPGELGPAVILGHVDGNDAPAVFYDLDALKPGAKVKVTRKDGTVAVFEVKSVEQFPKNDFPTERVYGELPYPGLRLITCGGVFNDDVGHYKDNIIAFAKMVSTHPANA